ncbi:MAG: iron-containing alcohol dehydrogenase [Gracilibacteraceae bacterium]|jgi:alcohol dehydrogenase class IV|nr:iron-containing alcohol dehydrogenase [Gracilibacteraceae bacterium]
MSYEVKLTPSIFSSPNSLLFGCGVAKQIGKHLKRLGCTKVLLVYDKGIEATGMAKSVAEWIEQEGLGVVHFNEVEADPPVWQAEKAGLVGREAGVDGVVGLGGGSSIDSGKAAKFLQRNDPPLKDYLGRGNKKKQNLSVPLVVIPTTAGTGSECTPGGTLTDTDLGIKTNINGPAAFVDLALLDPEMTVGLPAAITAATGMDALCHSAESYLSTLANPFCETTGREGIRLVAQHLKKACDEPGNMEARTGMMLAATLGGMSMLGPLCCTPHDVGRSLGAKFHMPHGNACAATLPQFFQLAAPYEPEKVRYIANCFGAGLGADASAEAIGQAAYDLTRNLMKSIPLKRMQDYGISRNDLLAQVPDEVVMQTAGFVQVFGQAASPMPVTKEFVSELVSRAYDEN